MTLSGVFSEIWSEQIMRQLASPLLLPLTDAGRQYHRGRALERQRADRSDAVDLLLASPTVEVPAVLLEILLQGDHDGLYGPERAVLEIYEESL